MKTSLGQAARRLTVAAASLYAIVIAGLALAWTIPSWHSDWVDLTNIFAFWLFGPLLLFVPAALVLRSGWLRGMTLLVLALFLASFGSAFAPQPAAPPDTGITLRVATFNLHYDNDDAEALAAWLDTHDIDIATFQEVSAPMAAGITTRLAETYPYQRIDREFYDLGVATVSRYPMEFLGYTSGYRGQPLRVMVDVQPVTLINVHLTAPGLRRSRSADQGYQLGTLRYDTQTRQQGAAELLDLIAKTQGPLIVMGDFNTSDREILYRRFASTMTDSYRETAWGLGYTFPNTRTWPGLPVALPLIRIDYVWTDNGVTPLAAQVSCASFSDHCAVIADLSLEGGVGFGSR